MACWLNLPGGMYEHTWKRQEFSYEVQTHTHTQSVGVSRSLSGGANLKLVAFERRAETSDGGGEAETETPFTLLQDTEPSQ